MVITSLKKRTFRSGCFGFELFFQFRGTFRELTGLYYRIEDENLLFFEVLTYFKSLWIKQTLTYNSKGRGGELR